MRIIIVNVVTAVKCSLSGGVQAATGNKKATAKNRGFLGGAIKTSGSAIEGLFLELAVAVYAAFTAAKLAFTTEATARATFVLAQVDRHAADAGALQCVRGFRRHASRQFDGARFIIEADTADEAAFNACFVGNGADDVAHFDAVIATHG